MKTDMDSNDIINHIAAQNKYLCFYFSINMRKKDLRLKKNVLFS